MSDLLGFWGGATALALLLGGCVVEDRKHTLDATGVSRPTPGWAKYRVIQSRREPSAWGPSRTVHYGVEKPVIEGECAVSSELRICGNVVIEKLDRSGL